MKITYDNIIYSLQNAGGISAYWSELASRFKTSDIDIAFYGHTNDNIFANKLNIDCVQETAISPKISRYLNFRHKLPKESIFHSSYYRISNQKEVINITTVHDFTYEHHRNGLARHLHCWQKYRAINKSNGIICVSENTKKDLLSFCPNIQENKIKVIYLGANKNFKPLPYPTKELQNRFNELTGKRFIMFVGDRKDYKNFNIAAKVMQQLRDYTFVIVGGGNLSDNEKLLLQKEYRHYQGIDTTDLNILYNNAFCLLYPSSYEGFGIPLLEAINAGCPTISANTSSIPEVVGNAGILINEIKTDKFIDAILKLDSINLRNKIITDGYMQAKKFSWDKCFNETIDFYKDTISRCHL